MSSNLDKVRGNEVCQWIEQVTGKFLIDFFFSKIILKKGEHINIDNLYESLKNGVILCKYLKRLYKNYFFLLFISLLNKLEPGTISNINHQNMPFKQMVITFLFF